MHGCRWMQVLYRAFEDMELGGSTAKHPLSHDPSSGHPSIPHSSQAASSQMTQHQTLSQAQNKASLSIVTSKLRQTALVDDPNSPSSSWSTISGPSLNHSPDSTHPSTSLSEGSHWPVSDKPTRGLPPPPPSPEVDPKLYIHMMDFAEKDSFLPTPSSSLPSAEFISTPHRTLLVHENENAVKQPPRSPGGTIMTAHGRYDKKPLPKEPLSELSSSPIHVHGDISPDSSSTTVQSLTNVSLPHPSQSKPVMTQQHSANTVPFSGSHDSLDQATLYSCRSSSREPSLSPTEKRDPGKRSQDWKTAVHAFSQFVKGNEHEPSAVDWHAPKPAHHHRKKG